ncbi:tRNA guanosine(34) transglycosylase Tgt [Flammeovirga kamogawensis]|uniref:Queuine tRNA-ribosyltransferase n=1 Tax=Flammeovirga kamogawensis TaxID=373891 RepID=A0ABX8GUJ4_9BACT|nr:tRNA guanosine(34) transglycosylase Tgt [Flammeovirga kamogawensis]MBB6459745.1 queuine tRNA-ribosyltransferase [Flammeovirga kamogawensis]QWG07196.1 tRNA guanosine(34) transglycosylase Tgt [Flammeovirga kamogawensis]TRX69016.1 tRNA guanosine(34) transglycosylase Tgt [Flammeovirga kamogawensis]
MGLKFEVKHKDPQTKARAGKITTDHGEIQTPIFMPVGTAGTVKAVHQRELKEDINADIILGNTYHLYLRPGTEILEKAGGLHKFNGWDRPILTDSGGYQVFSLAQTRKIKEEGVTFRSHIDGSKHLFTPERVMDIQRSIGADIIMAFDECPPYPSDYTYAKNSMHLTHRWLQRCVDRLDETVPLYGHHQALFPIVQGSTYKDLRTQSAEKIASFEREGNAIGGLSVGEPAEMMYEFTELCCDILPEDKPRYLMGVGTPANILENIALGVDMLDCVMPTRQARHGHVFTTQGIMNLKNKKWEDDFTPIDQELGGYVSTFYSKGYLRHMFKANEALAGMVASVHNLTFYLWLVREARQHIIDGDFREWKNAIIPTLMQRL